MTVVLNFGITQKNQVKKVLEKFEVVETKTDFEELRAKIDSCTVTLYSSGKLSIQGEKAETVRDRIMQALNLKSKLVFGLDETGRSEITGPFVIAGVLGETNELRELRDSKKSSDIKGKFEIVSRNSLVQFIYSFNSEFIDLLRQKGFTLNEIEKEVINSSSELIKKFESKALIKVDGNPINDVVKEVKFIVKGDDLDPVIGSASIVAKHFRNESKDEKYRKTWNVKKK